MSAGRARILAVAALAVLTLACRAHEEEEVATTGVVPVTVASVRRGTIRAVVTATAVVKPASGAELDVVPPAPARIAELPAGIGDHVAKGGLLVRFEVPSLAAELSAREADVRSARATLDSARAAFDRASHLVDRGIAASKELEIAARDRTSAESGLTAAESALAAARLVAARAVVRAPFAGVVVSREHNPGDLVEVGADPILRFVDPLRLLVEASVSVADLPHVKVGASARVTAPSTIAPETATVLAVPGAVDPQTAVALVRLGLSATTALPSGTPVSVAIVADERDGTLIVPSAAVVHEEDDAFVYVVDDKQIAHRRVVIVGVVAEPEAEILSGLEADERVVSRGAAALPDGAKVAIRE